MKNDLQKHKKSDGVKWFCTLLAVLMLAVAVTAAITQGFKNWNPYGWFDKQEQTDPSGGAIDGDGNEMGEGVHEMPKQMTFRNADALADESMYTEVTLHATVKPDDAEDKRVSWGIVFKNPESTWAKGKTVTDYVTITPQSEGSSVATVKCLKPFGEQIHILAGLTMYLDMLSVVDIEEIYAISDAWATLDTAVISCSVDFAQRITSASIDLTSGEKTMTVDAFANSVTSAFSLNDGFMVGSAYRFKYTDYTIEDTFTTSMFVSADKDIFATAQSATGDKNFAAGSCSLSLVSVDNSLSMAFNANADLSFTANVLTLNLYSRWLGENLDSGLICFEFAITGTYSSYTKKVPVHFTADTLKIMPTEIILDDTDLII